LQLLASWRSWDKANRMDSGHIMFYNFIIFFPEVLIIYIIYDHIRNQTNCESVSYFSSKFNYCTFHFLQAAALLVDKFTGSDQYFVSHLIGDFIITYRHHLVRDINWTASVHWEEVAGPTRWQKSIKYRIILTNQKSGIMMVR